ncbi:hypothetical protein [Rhodococcus sp. C3V]|uniref:hypothetical protein n=1 Tax=Rhodococcus sp. C3V TaxID=3034165 RepID=UPI0023E1E048|nr:hypothetical protein [Rhodococcus sp. C3V]MDF3316487.1 hypothetical protein [Rhodococcus sp. C3V]
MTIIFEDFTDLALNPDDVTVSFFGVPIRENSTGDGVITPAQVEVKSVGGVVTSPFLDPGPARVEVNAGRWLRRYDVMIPDSGTHRLFELEEIIIAEHKVVVKGDKGDVGAGVNLSGSVDTYADLGPGPWDLGAAFVVNSDGLLYIYGVGGWPAEGSGAAFRGERGLSVNSVAVVGNQLQFGLEDSTALPKVTVPVLVQASADASAASASRAAAEAARGEAVTAKDAAAAAKAQVDSARSDVLAAKASVDGSVATIAADKATVIVARDTTFAATAQAEGFASTASAQAGAATASATASNGYAIASQVQADRAFSEADRAEAAADEIAAGSVADNAISTVKVQDGAVTKPKLGTSVQASLDKADSAVQGADPRLSDARTPTAHTHTIGNVTGLQTALDGKSATSHSHTAADISDATTVGRNVLKAADAAAARTAIGAGASNLLIGTTSATAMRGDANQIVTVLPASGQLTGVIYHVTE